MVTMFSGTTVWTFIYRGFQRFRKCSNFSYFLRLFGSGLSGLGEGGIVQESVACDRKTEGKRIPSPGGERVG